MNRYGLIGKNISYSFSQKFFEDKFKKENIDDCSYQIFDLNEISEVERIFNSNEIRGLNVTIPYKEKIIPFLDKISPEADEIGAVNCVKITKGLKIGYNTDVIGFEISLLNWIETNRPNALILGSGGAAKAVRFVLNRLGINNKTVSRNGVFTYSDLNQKIIGKHQLIINCTPLGTFPDTEKHPEIPYEHLTSEHYLFDLIYNPAKTKFLVLGQENGAKIKNGFEMLEIQAEKSWEIWQQFL